jgi:hypothetical protein
LLPLILVVALLAGFTARRIGARNKPWFPVAAFVAIVSATTLVLVLAYTLWPPVAR